MELKNNRVVSKIVIITTGDLGLIEEYATSDLYPYTIWIDKQQIEEDNGDLKTFLLEHEQEYKLLINGDVDYIVVEYDM